MVFGLDLRSLSTVLDAGLSPQVGLVSRRPIDYSGSSEQVTNACHAANQLLQRLTLTTPTTGYPGCTTTAANICGRLKSQKCQRPSLLRVVAIVMLVAVLLAAGFSVFMYLSSMENKKADPPTKESSNKRMLKSRMVSPALSKMAPAQDWLVTTLPDNTTELSQMADTQPDQITSLPGVISTNKTGKSTNLGLPRSDSPHVPDSDFQSVPLSHQARDVGIPRCRNGYKLLAGTCIRLVVSTGWFRIKAGKFYYDAKLACRMEGATLAMPKTEELDVALRGLVKSEGDNKEHWIGMEEKDGTWYWADGSVVDSNGDGIQASQVTTNGLRDVDSTGETQLDTPCGTTRVATV
ncbi:hypothetical protein Bbelb_309990 [Branchiostoma belcheri]|nr:hypothetical protein Bbelb_309990 [Branchiostoma belcheri]